MHNLKRLGVVACATAAGVVFAAEQASAVIIVDTMDGTSFSPRETTLGNTTTAQQSALVQGFTITDASVLNTAAIRGYSQGADVTIAITSMIGPGSTAMNVLFDQVFTTVADTIGASIRSFDLGALALGAGDYYFVVMSSDSTGFEWSKVSRSGSIGVNDRGASTFPSASSWYAQQYAFETAESSLIFTLEIDGSVVPAPGGAALLIGAVAGMAPRRKRR